MHHANLISVLDDLPVPRILVFGDLWLDRYVWGNVERVSQEAPVLLLRSQRTESYPGGAAGVCRHLRALEADVRCAGLVGNDAAGTMLRRMLGAIDVDCATLLDDIACSTAVTERFIGRTGDRHWHQILRVEHEVRRVPAADADSAFANSVAQGIGDSQATLIYDSGRGTCTPERVAAILGVAADRDVPVVVAPSSEAELSRYRGATALAVERHVAESATGVALRSDADLLAAAGELCRRLELEAIIIAGESPDLAFVHASGQGKIFSAPSSQTANLVDARQVVLAAFGLVIGGGATVLAAAKLACVAGRLAAQRHGTPPVSRDDIRIELLREHGGTTASKVVRASEITRIAEVARQNGRKVVFTNGCFDILHEGHVTYLEDAAAQGDLLLVGLNSDSSVRGLKGPTRPVRKEDARAGVLAALACVDYVVVFDEPTPKKLIEAVRPDVLVKGGDWRGREHEIAGSEFVESYGGRLYLAAVVDGVSTTEIVRSIAA